MMTGKQMSLTTMNNLVAPWSGRRRQPAFLALLARLFTPTDWVQSRLRAAQSSLEKAAARLEDSSPKK